MTDKPGDKNQDEQERMSRLNEEESPEVEGHRLNYGPEEPGAFKPRKDDESDDGEGRFGT